MKIALSPLEKLRGVAKFIDVTVHRRPLSVSIEVTKRCNARCDFCDYWKTSDRDELTSYTDVVRRFDPLVVVLTGGEPMLRPDLVRVAREVKQVPGFRYVTLLTHGGLLSERKVQDLVDAGVNQVNVSLNYPDARQDAERGIPGLFEKIEAIVPKMASAGCSVFSLSAMLMLGNMGSAEQLVRLAHRWGVNIAFSGYNDLKNGNGSHFVAPRQLEELRAVCDRLVALKRELGNVMTSDYFFETLPLFYERRHIPGCKAGQIMLHVSPTGMVQPCAELAAVAHYADFDARSFPPVECDRCFDSCRAEPQAPLTLRRAAEILGLA